MSYSRMQLEVLEPRIMLAADAVVAEAVVGSIVGNEVDVVWEEPEGESIGVFEGFESGGLFEGFDESDEAATAENEVLMEVPVTGSSQEENETENQDAATFEKAVAETLEEVELSVFETPTNEAAPITSEGDLNDFSPTLVSTLHAANGPPIQNGEQNAVSIEDGNQHESGLPTLQLIPEATVTWISDNDGFWDEGSNWSTGTAPTSSDSVLIDRGTTNVTVTVRSNATVAYLISNESLSISGGTFTISTEGEFNGPTDFSGGKLAGGSLTNSGVLTLSGDGIKFLSGTLNNTATIIHSDGTLALSGGVINNQGGGLFDFAGDSSLRWWSSTHDFNNSGTVRKSGGTGVSTMTGGGSGIAFNNAADGVIEVLTGTLSLNGSGSSTGGTFAVAADAVLDLTGGSRGSTFGGTYTGSGGGTILLGGGVLSLATDAIFNFPAGLFQWTGGTLSGGSLANTGSITIADSGIKFLSTTLNNTGTIAHSDGTLAFNGGVINNLGGSLFDFSGDSSLRWWSRTHDFNNSGTVRKSGGTGVSTMTGGGSGISFNNAADGVIDVQTGTLSLNGSGTSTGGTFTVATDAVLDLTGGSTSSTLAGTYMGSGGGTVLIQSGEINLGDNTVFDFPTGLLRWTGGTLSGGSLANTGFITIADSRNKFLSTTMNNTGTIVHSDGTLALNGGVINNQSSGLFDFTGDSSLRWWSSTHDFNNSGIVRKSGGDGVSTMTGGGSGISFNNAAEGVIEVQTGTLSFNGSGSSTGGRFDVVAGAVLDLTGGSTSNTLAGTYTGSGGGTVLIQSGKINLGEDTVFDFPTGLLRWTGGRLNGALLNNGAMIIAGSGIHFLSGTLNNAGTITQTDDGILAFIGGVIHNQPGAVYDFAGDGSLRWWSGTQGQFNNEGTLKKSDGIGASNMTGGGSPIAFNNAADGVIEVQTGTVLLNGNGFNSGGTFQVAGNARLDFNGSQTLTGTYTGSGYGNVVISGGTITGDENTRFNFSDKLFEWTGGTLAGTFANTGAMAIVGTGIRTLSGTLNNSGIIQHQDTGVVAFIRGVLNNELGGVYDFTGDGAFRWWSGTQGLINNAGLLRKTGGLDESNFSGGGSVTILNNTGTVEVSSGTLNVNGPNTQISSGTLTGGTWIANDGTLNLNAAITTNDGILILAGNSGNIPAIAGLATNNGSLTIRHDATFTPSVDFTNQGILTLDAGGEMNVSGDFTQGAGATLTFAIGGPSIGGNFGTLTVSGAASLAGGMEVTLADGYGPQTGDSYTVATYGSRTGTFEAETGLAPFFTSDLGLETLVFNAIRTASDLAASAVSNPGARAPGESATITFTVTNLSGTAATGPWKDTVYISTDTTWDASDVLAGSRMGSGDLAVGASYNGSVTFDIPSIPNNHYFILVVTDSEGVVPDTDRMNNYTSTVSAIEIATTRVHVIATSPMGIINRPFNFFDVTFNQIINNSTFTTDDVFLTGPGGVIEAASVTALGGNVYRVGFENQRANGTYTLRVGPNIATHVGSLMDQDDNGTPGEEIVDAVTFSITVVLPDLTAAKLDLPTTPILQGSTITLTWRVLNQGTLVAVANWTESIIASTDDILGNGDDVVLGSTTVTFSLGKRNSKPFLRGTHMDVRRLEVVIPRTLLGEYKLFVQVDSGDTVVEANETNQSVSGSLTVAPISPRVDLMVSTINVPTEAQAGSTMDVSWTVTNSGSTATLGMVWVDGIYLSSDDTLDSGDIVLGYNLHLGPLESEASYSGTRSVLLPMELSSSTYRILVVSDVINLVFESGSELNNTLSSSPITVVAQTSSVTIPSTLAQSAHDSFSGTSSVQAQAAPGFTGLANTDVAYPVFPLLRGSGFHLQTVRRNPGDYGDFLGYFFSDEN